MSDALEAERPRDETGRNLTRAGVTGKVPTVEIRRRGKARARKPVKLSGHQRSHVKSLMRQGAISPAAAHQNGLNANKK